MKLDFTDVEKGFKAFLSSSKADHSILYIPSWGFNYEPRRGSLLSSFQIEFLDSCFHRSFMKVVHSEGFEIVNIFCSYDLRSSVCFLLSRKLNTSSGHQFTSRAFESLHVAGVFWNDTALEVSCWDDITSQHPNLLLCSTIDRVVRASPSAKYFEKENVLQEEYKDLEILARTLAALRALNSGCYVKDTKDGQIYSEPIPHVHDEPYKFFQERQEGDWNDSDFLLGEIPVNTVTALPYGFLKVTDEDINEHDKPRKPKEDNAARKEKKRQYRKNLKARKKAKARDPLKESIEQQNSESDTLFDGPFSGSGTELVMALPPELQRRMQSFPQGSEPTTVESNVAGWIIKVILISLGFQVCVLWKGMAVIEFLVAFGVGYFAALPPAG